MAVKVLDIDSVDFKVNTADRDASYDDFLKELKTLQQIQSYGAKNVNRIFEVLEVHSQLWIVSEYCPGGSVHTLVSFKAPAMLRFLGILLFLVLSSIQSELIISRCKGQTIEWRRSI